MKETKKVQRKTQKLIPRPVVFGCDPEFFFAEHGRVIGADQVLPTDGLMFNEWNEYGSMISTVSRIIIDGVQAELNPLPHVCRQSMGRELAHAFSSVSQFIAGMGKELTIDFRQTIELDDSDMEKLSDRSKKFGCMPSKNAHNEGKEGFIGVDASVYKYRSAGGHWHIGAPSGYLNEKEIREVLAQPERLVKMLDLIVGNTCVLIDRDPGNIERRKVYGRAGEFRTPPHGVEYRTLSNFWLRSAPLASMAMGLARTAVCIVADNLDDEFKKLVDMKDVQDAINNNDFKLALSNFKKIESLLLEITPFDEYFDIDSTTIKMFKHFVKMGLDYWFEDPLTEWSSENVQAGLGFGSFLQTTVAEDMKTNA